MTAKAPARTRKIDEHWLVVAIWLAVCVAMVWLSRSSIATRKFPDPDDAMRLLQVRDWIAGQNWFDVTQYRLNAPAGVPMHWSRLVDVPIAAVILLARPFVGQQWAEGVALTVVPLVTLGIAMLLMYRIAAVLMEGRGALLAVIAMSVSLGTLQQMRPMRIDHHGWQIVLALTGVLAALSTRRLRPGLIAGAAMAAWLNISIEGLPFAAAIGALFGFNWLVDPTDDERLTGYASALAGVSLLLFGLTHLPRTWTSQPHDVVTIAHLAGFCVAACGALLAVRPEVADLKKRLIVLACIGAAALVAMFATDPRWMQGPFDSLDPLVRDMWYFRVDEGLPIWRLVPSQVAIALAQPIVGFAGAFIALRRSDGAKRRLWLTYLYFLLVSALASAFVVRWATTASIISLPGTAFLCLLALRRAQALPLMPLRVLATAAAFFVIAPAYALPVSVTSIDKRVQHAVSSYNQCLESSELGKLNALPTGNIAAPLDIAPAILVNTRHSAVASGHHRGGEAMADVIRLFVLAPTQGREIVERRQVDYLVFCPGAPETVRYAYHGGDGLTAMLSANRIPDWLEPVQVPGLRALRVWRVRKG